MTSIISFTWHYLNNPKTKYEVVAECYALDGELHAIVNYDNLRPLTTMAHVSKVADPFILERAEKEAIRQYNIHLTDAVMHQIH